MAPSEQAAALYRTWFGMLEQWARMFSPWLQPAGKSLRRGSAGGGRDGAGRSRAGETDRRGAEPYAPTAQPVLCRARRGAARTGLAGLGGRERRAAQGVLRDRRGSAKAVARRQCSGDGGNRAGVERWWPAVRAPRVPGRCSTSGRLTRCWTDWTVRSARSRTRSAWDPRGHCATPGASSSPRTCSGARRSSTISPSLPERGATSSTASASGSARWVRAASASSRWWPWSGSGREWRRRRCTKRCSRSRGSTRRPRTSARRCAIASSRTASWRP